MSESNPLAIFKKATLGDNSLGNKKRAWKSLKQILATERMLQWPENAITCKLLCFLSFRFQLYRYSLCSIDSTINTPPSFVPAKKYSDISGLIAPYTDPQSKLYYYNADEFNTIRSLPSDLTAGYLALRGASSIVG